MIIFSSSSHKLNLTIPQEIVQSGTPNVTKVPVSVTGGCVTTNLTVRMGLMKTQPFVSV